MSKLVSVFSASVVNVVVRFLPFPVKGAVVAPSVDGAVDAAVVTLALIGLFLVGISNDPSVTLWFGLSLTPTEVTCEVNGRLVKTVKRPISVSAETPGRKAIVAKRWTTISRRETAEECCIVLFFKFVRVNLIFGVWCLCMVFGVLWCLCLVFVVYGGFWMDSLSHLNLVGNQSILHYRSTGAPVPQHRHHKKM